MIFTGKEVSDAILRDIKRRLDECQSNRAPHIACIRLGDDPGDMMYEKSIVSKSNIAGVTVDTIRLSRNPLKNELLDLIDRLNRDDTIDGILMFRPFGDKELEIEASLRIDPAKDIEGIRYNEYTDADIFYPCTAEAVMEMLDYYNVELKDTKTAVIGRSPVIGKPVAKLLRERGAIVTVCHSKTLDLKGECLKADIIVSAAGRVGLVKEDMVRPGQVVIDVGINQTQDGRMVGDVDFENVKDKVSAISPMRGGVGSITSAVLLKHVAYAFFKKLDKDSKR